MLADSENEKSKWVGVLSELHKILKKNKFRDRSVYVPKEAYDSTLPLIKTTQAAAILGMRLSRRHIIITVYWFMVWVDTTVYTVSGIRQTFVGWMRARSVL